MRWSWSSHHILFNSQGNKHHRGVAGASSSAWTLWGRWYCNKSARHWGVTNAGQSFTVCLRINVWLTKVDWCNQELPHIIHVANFLLCGYHSLSLAQNIIMKNPAYPLWTSALFSLVPPCRLYITSVWMWPSNPTSYQADTRTRTQKCWAPFITLAVEQSKRWYKLQPEIWMTVTHTHTDEARWSKLQYIKL